MKLSVAFALISVSVAAFASNGHGEEPAVNKPSPHGVEGSCQVCHVETEARLNRWSLFSFGIDKKKMVTDNNTLCRQCHGVDFGHGVGKTPHTNSENLPLDGEGKISCAITCHYMHIKSDDYNQTRYHLRLPATNLCLSCHPR